MRERLIELLLKLPMGKSESEVTADYLLENGVVVPPVNVENTIYYLFWFNGTKIGKARVEEIYFNGDSFAYRVSREWSRFDLQENEVFLSREAAENALKEREKT